jgi:hypothetical protein
MQELSEYHSRLTPWEHKPAQDTVSKLMLMFAARL